MPILSDEEFLAQAPELEKQLEASLKASETSPTATPEPTPPAEPTTDEAFQETPPPVEPEASTEPVFEEPTGEEPEPEDVAAPAAKSDEAEGDEPSPTENEETTEEPVQEEPDYKAIYERLFRSPIRAAGQDITLQNPDEAISLIQKGVGFHTKMNRLHSDLKYVEMLRNNGLLDEEKLSLLIDAQAGKPGAIKKLLDSAKVDPLELDSAEASNYAPSDYRVTDEQVHLQTTVADLSATETGRAVLTDAQGWDQATKAEIYKTPAVLSVLAEQKEMGRYDLIVAEINRAKLLGQLPVGETFLQSYTRVGQQMMQAGKFEAKPPVPTPTPVAQKVVKPTPPANSKKAAAAAPTRATTPGAKPQVDISEMDDETFQAHFRKTFRL